MVKTRSAKIDGGFLAALLTLTAFAAGFIAYLILDRTVFSNKPVPVEYQYPIEDLAKIDPAQVLYRQQGDAIDTGMKSTAAIELDREGTIYIAGDEKIAVFSPDGKPLKEIALPSAPTALFVADDKTVYVALTDHIEIYSPDGQKSAVWEKPADKALLTAIAVGKDDVFAADALGRVVRHYDRQGNLLQSIGAKDAARNIPGIIVPSPYFDLLIAPDGLLRVINPGRHKIEAYTFNGDLEWSWGKASVGLDGFSGCCNPIAFAMLPNGDFVTCEKGLVRIKVYDADGNVVGVVAGPDQLGWQAPLRVCETPEDCQLRGLDAAADAAGRVYVLDQERNVVRIFVKK